jgi:hypothetical protein
MKKYLILFIKRIVSIILFFVIGSIMIIPFGLVYLFLGIDKACEMMDVIEAFSFKILK